MQSEGSVTHWIAEIKAGDHAAAQRLWERYFPRLVRLAYKKLRSSDRRASDEEDVALNVFDSFCRGAKRGRFPRLSDRDNLWPLLVAITDHKARDHLRHARRQKRGGGAVQGESVFRDPTGSVSDVRGIEQVVSQEPTPEFAAQMAEEFQCLLALLDDDALRSLAVLKLEGYSNKEAAAKLGWALRKVERKISLIRSIWAEQAKR